MQKVSEYPVNDLWHFPSTTGDWNEVIFNRSGILVPPPRFDHAAAVVDSEMFVFGGRNNSGVCFKELWIFNIAQGKWSIVEARNRGQNLAGLLQPCIASAVAQAGQLWIAVGCGYVNANVDCLDSEIQIWMFVVHLAIWEPVNVYNDDLLVESNFSKLGFWGGYLISLTNTQPGLLYMKVGCPAGLA